MGQAPAVPVQVPNPASSCASLCSCSVPFVVHSRRWYVARLVHLEMCSASGSSAQDAPMIRPPRPRRMASPRVLKEVKESLRIFW